MSTDPNVEGKMIEELSTEKTSLTELGMTRGEGDEGLSVDFGGILDDVIQKKGIEFPAEAPIKKQEPVKSEEAPKEEPKEQVEEQPKEVEEAIPEKQAEEKPKTEESTEKKEQPEAKKEEKPLASAEKTRDSDIESLETKLDPHTKPATRKNFDFLKAETKKARDLAEAKEKELSEARKQLEEAKKNTVPKEVQEEIEQLRNQVRAIDASKDPAIINKYDKKIESNKEFVLKTLTDAGLPPTIVESIKKSGVSLSSVKTYIDMLETGKGSDGKQYDADPDTAEALREAFRENNRLTKGKEAEISEWKQNHEVKQKQVAAEQERIASEANARLTKELSDHVGKWEFLKKPDDPLDTDTPAVRKEKERRISEHNARILKFSEATKKETATAMDAAVSAQIGILYRENVVPELVRQIESLRKELSESKTQVGKMKTAGSVSKSVSPTPQPAKQKEEEPSLDADDVVDQIARKIGILK